MSQKTITKSNRIISGVDNDMKPTNRVLYNADCNTYFYNYLKGTDAWQKAGSLHGEFSPKAIHAYVDLLTRNGVDTLVYNPNTQRAWWPSKTTPKVWDGYRRGNAAYFYGHILGQSMTPEQVETQLKNLTDMMDRYLDLVQNGVDLLSETSKACRHHRISPWLSIRMNDMHGANNLAGSFMNSPLLAHKEFRLEGHRLETKGSNPRNQALNYEKREVRDYMFTMIRELIEDYDFEGIELDWTRHAYCCNPVASQKTIDTLTGWHKEIAQLCRKKSNKTARPYHFGVRSAANFPQLRHIGLDVVEMAREGFLDFVCPTRAGWTTTWDLDYERMRGIFGKKVTIYGVVETAPNWLPAHNPKLQLRQRYRSLPASPAMVWGNAAGKLAAGADGIEIFNYFCSQRPDYTAIKNVGDLKKLRGKRKFYAFSAGFEDWGVRTFLEVDEHLPQWFEPTTQRRFRIPMCAEPEGTELTIQVIIEKPLDGRKLPDFGVSFNESWPNWTSLQTNELLEPADNLTHHAPENIALNFRFPSSAIRENWNDIILILGGFDPVDPVKRREQGIKVVGLELLVDKPKPPSKKYSK